MRASINPEKISDSERIARQTAEFIAKGGKVERRKGFGEKGGVFSSQDAKNSTFAK